MVIISSFVASYLSHIHTHMHMHICICTYARTCTYTDTYAYLAIYIYIYICIRILCISIYRYIKISNILLCITCMLIVYTNGGVNLISPYKDPTNQAWAISLSFCALRISDNSWALDLSCRNFLSKVEI